MKMTRCTVVSYKNKIFSTLCVFLVWPQGRLRLQAIVTTPTQPQHNLKLTQLSWVWHENDFAPHPNPHPPQPHPLCHMKGRSAVFTQIRVLSVIFTQIWVLSVIFTQMKVLSVIFTQMRVLSVIFTQMQVFSVVQGIQVFSCKLCEACTLLQPNPTWAGIITMVPEANKTLH